MTGDIRHVQNVLHIRLSINIALQIQIFSSVYSYNMTEIPSFPSFSQQQHMEILTMAAFHYLVFYIL